MLKTFKLKNGIKVATFSIPEMKSVYLSISAKAGSLFDIKENSGAAHFMEHLLVQGVPTFPNVETFSEYIESIAGSYNASTSRESINFNIHGPAQYINELIKITSEVFFEPLFPSDSIERERNAIFEEINSRQNETWYKNAQFFNKIRFNGNHPMHLDPGGSIETVAKLKREEIINYYSQFFSTRNTYLIAIGGFKDIKKQIEKYFGNYKQGEAFKDYPNFSNKDMSTRTIAIRPDNELKSAFVDLSFPTVTGQNPWQVLILNTLTRYMLVSLRRSRLFKLLRQKKGLVYHVGLSNLITQKFGYSTIMTQVSVENLDEVLELISKELKVFYQNGPETEELEFAKNYLVNSIFMNFDHPSSIANWIEGELLWEEKIYMPEDYEKEIKKVTCQDITNFMKKFWEFDKLNLTVQGPVENTKQNLQKFEKIMDNLN